MPSSLPKYSGLISEHQLSILDEFIALHEGISKARVLGRLLEAWQDAGKPILGDRDRTLRDLALQFEQLDLDVLVAQKVREYLDMHLDSLVNNVVENKLRPLSTPEHRETVIDNNLVKNELVTNDLEDDESSAESKIADDGGLKVVTDSDKDEREIFSLPVQDEQLEDKQEEESDQVSNKDINQVDSLNQEGSNQGTNQVDSLNQEGTNQVDSLNQEGSNKDTNSVDDLNQEDINKDTNSVDDLNQEDINKDTNQVDNLNQEGSNKSTNPVNNVSEEDTSLTEKGHNKVSNKVINKVIENDEEKPEVEDSSMSTITEENPVSQLVITLDKSEVNNQADVSHIPADFLALPKGKVKTQILAQTLGLSSPARVSELASGKKKTLPFPEFWDYMEVKATTKTLKNGKQVNSYDWTKIR